MSSLPALNPRQREAVRYIDTPLLVLAGAGSGKTRVITEKIGWLIRECEYKAHQIAAVTFTNKAAKEMKERVGRLLGSEARGLQVSTFHSLGLDIIRREINVLGYKRGFSIFDQQDSQALLRELLLKTGDVDNDYVEMAQHIISNWKNDLQTPDVLLQRAATPGEMNLAQLYERYLRSMKAYNAVDFDDLIALPVQLFEKHPDVLSRWRQRIRYLLVDEYQDTNSCQYRLVQLLVGERNGLTVVGDDDQSIYAWRGARPENLEQLERDFRGLKLIKLEQNYRSCGRILKAANQLIANNPHAFDKALWSELGYGDPIRVLHCASEEAESERIATDILMMHLQQRESFRNFAVLYRSNHQSRMLEMQLQQMQVPYTITGGTSFFARAEIKDVMAYLRLLANPDDDNAFLRIINVPRRKIGPGTLEKLGLYSQSREGSLCSAIEELAIESVLSGEALERLRQFVRMLEETRVRCAQEDPVAVITELLDDIGYEAWLHQNATSAAIADRRMDNVRYLIESLSRSLTTAEDDDTDSASNGLDNVREAIGKLVLRDLLERQEEEEDLDRVQLLTLHAAKGLEFPHVFIMGWEEEILPHRNSIESDQIEEERRLAYVGITRAQRTLTLTLARKRKRYGQVVEPTPSRFLEELPEDDLSCEGGDQVLTQEQRDKKARDTMNDLMSLFD
ncbi:MAG: DNA helicase Rep [Pseudomonadales bacterium]|nr:DNA helicase Rep [Pseudomonadales bacterium]